MAPLRIVFFGTAELACPSLSALTHCLTASSSVSSRSRTGPKDAICIGNLRR